MKRSNLHLIVVPESDEENETKLENILQDIIQENFPNLARQANIQRTPQTYSSRRATPRHIIVGFTKVEMKEKVLGQPERKVMLATKASLLDLQQISQQKLYKPEESGGPIFNILKKQNLQPRISYPAKRSFTTEGKIKSFMNKQELRNFITTRPALQELLKEALHIERNNQY